MFTSGPVCLVRLKTLKDVVLCSWQPVALSSKLLTILLELFYKSVLLKVKQTCISILLNIHHFTQKKL